MIIRMSASATTVRGSSPVYSTLLLLLHLESVQRVVVCSNVELDSIPQGYINAETTNKRANERSKEKK